jgi:hypothetical protein
VPVVCITAHPDLPLCVCVKGSKALSLAVQWGLELAVECEGKMGPCLAEHPAFVGLKDVADVKAFFAELPGDQQIGTYSAQMFQSIFSTFALLNG